MADLLTLNFEPPTEIIGKYHVWMEFVIINILLAFIHDRNIADGKYLNLLIHCPGQLSSVD